MATPLHKNPSTGRHEIYNFGRHFLGHHYYTRSTEENFKRNTSILHFLPLGVGVMKFTISGLLPLHMLYSKFGKDLTNSFLGEDVKRRRTTDAALRRTQSHRNILPQ